MPYTIEKEGSCFKVINKKTGKVHAKCTTKAKAEAQLHLLQGVEHGWEPSGKKTKNECKDSNERAGLEDFDETKTDMPKTKKKKKEVKESNVDKLLRVFEGKEVEEITEALDTKMKVGVKKAIEMMKKMYPTHKADWDKETLLFDVDGKLHGQWENGTLFYKFKKAQKVNEALDTKMEVFEGNVPDKHQKKIALDTIKNPDKALLGGMSVKEAEEILKKKFGYTQEQIDKLK